MLKRKNNEEVIEMEQTTFVQKHAKKILLAGGAVVAVGAFIALKKHDVAINILKDDIELKEFTINKLLGDNETLMAAASEGLFEEALATTTRKLNSRKDRYEYLNNVENKTPEIMEKIKQLYTEIKVLEVRKLRFAKAQELMEIKDLD